MRAALLVAAALFAIPFLGIFLAACMLERAEADPIVTVDRDDGEV